MPTAEHRAAYEGLLRRYTGPLRRLAWSYGHDPAGRDDLFQEIAMALWTALPRFRGESSG
jgi:DNA-directed RNA polymerase specialized sigma24 family protein